MGGKGVGQFPHPSETLMMTWTNYVSRIDDKAWCEVAVIFYDNGGSWVTWVCDGGPKPPNQQPDNTENEI